MKLNGDSGARSDRFAIKDSVFIEMPIPYPNLEEQKKIGKFFNTITILIALHQRKLNHLKDKKKSLLQKMFPKNGEDFPELRFPGFTDAWEQRKLGDYIVEYKEVSTENNQYPALTSSRRGIFLQKEYFAGNQIASDDNTGYNIVPRNYFTYRHMSDDEIFCFNINDIVEYGIVSTLYPVFTTTNELDSRYLQYQLNNGYEFAKFAILQKQGGSRTYMYLSKLKELSLTIPINVEEQRKISSYLRSIDHLITLHQRKLNHLQEQKKSLLQQMFI
jgi:type I restriction enzyme S subunit